MGQRVMIAMMLAPDPELLIADEPTSALDATVQAEILRLIEDLVSRRGMGLLLISHDLPLVAHFCDRVAVMYAGRIVEELRAGELRHAQHPYTRGLLGCMPRSTHPQARPAGDGARPGLARGMIEVEDLAGPLRRRRGGARRVVQRAERRQLRPGRRKRLGQEHDPARASPA